MAVKKSTTKKSATATKKAAPKKSAAKKASKPKAAKKAGAKKATPKKATAMMVKLTDKQLDLLKTVSGTKDKGYLADKKAEAKTLDALASKKMIKRGAKDKMSGVVRYHVSKTGEKHVSTGARA
jgi:hypothetical protein